MGTGKFLCKIVGRVQYYSKCLYNIETLRIILDSPIKIRNAQPKRALNSLPKNKILTLTVKVIADNKFNVAKIMNSVNDRVENVVRKENAGYQHFLLFPQCFLKGSFSRSLEVRIVW